MMRIRFLAATVVLLAGGQAIAESPSAEGGRVETMGELERFKPYGEIERLGLFLRDPGAVELPNLRRAGFLTIESDEITSVSLPSLETVRYLIIRGRQIKKLELPRLRSAGAIEVQGTTLGELDLSALRGAGELIVTSNPELGEIKTPFVNGFSDVALVNNPGLTDEARQRLESLKIPRRQTTTSLQSPTLKISFASNRPTGRRHARFDTNHVSRPRDTHRDVYPRYVPFYPIFRPFLAGFWSNGRAPF
jgi:hypothetical protein